MQTALSRANEVSQIPYTAHRGLTDTILRKHICFSMYVPIFNAEALVSTQNKFFSYCLNPPFSI